MKKQQLVQFAAMCIQALEAQAGRPLSVQEISRTKGIPLPACADIVRCLDRAGIVRLEADQAVLLRDDVTVLDVLEAVWSRSKQQPVLRMLACFAGELQIHVTREYVRQTWATGMEAING